MHPPIDQAAKPSANFALVGNRLKDYYCGNRCGKIYLALVTLDWEGNLFERVSAAGNHVEWLRDCLRDHTYDDGKCEATIQDPEGSEIILNIWEWAKGDDATAVLNMVETILVKQGKYHQTYTMFSKDYGDEERNIPAWGVRCYKGRPRFLPAASTSHSWGLRICCNNYLYRQRSVDWVFIEWTGRRSVDGVEPGGIPVIDELTEEGYDLDREMST